MRLLSLAAILVLYNSASTFSQTLWLDSLYAEKNLHDTTIILTISDRARAFMRTSPDSAIIYFKELVDFADKSKSTERIIANQKASATRFIGIAYRQLGDNEAAINYYSEAIELFRKIDAHAGVALCYRNIGNVYFFQSNYPKAIEFYNKALEFFEEVEDGNGMASIYNNLGNIYENQGNYKAALENYYKGLKIFEELENHSHLSACYTNIGIIHYRQRNWDLALENLEKSNQIKQKIGDTRGASTVLTNMSAVYMGKWEHEQSPQKKQELVDKAVSMLEESVSIKRDLNDTYGMTLSYNSLGEIYSKIGLYKKALDYLYLSLNLSKSINNNRVLVFVYKNIASILYNQGKVSESIEMAHKGLTIAQEIESLTDQKSILFLLVKAYSSIGECNLLSQYFNTYEAVSDSLFSHSRAKAIVEIETRYQTEQKEQEIELLSQENELKGIRIQNARRERNLYVIILVSLIIFSTMLYVLYINRRRTNKLLELKNEELHSLNITKDKFISILAHDLKNPFSSFINITSALSSNFDQIENNDKKQYLDQLNSSAIKVNNLLKNMLEWAAIKYKPTVAEVDNLNLCELSDQVKNGLSTYAYEFGVTIENHISDDLRVCGNKTYVSSILNNLVTNAVKFSNKGGVVSIYAEANDNSAKITVEDSGVGLSPNDIEKLFRIDIDTNTIGKPEGKGTGMGLILCKELIDKLNGKIWVESKLTEGSKFIFTLPLSSQCN